MSIVPISTNFTGIQRRLVPKCLLIDIYDLNLIPPDGIILEKNPLTLCVLAGGSIITNIQIISQIIVTNDRGIQYSDYPYIILFQAGTTFESEIVNFPLGNLNSIIQTSNVDPSLNQIYKKLGTPLPSNSQIYVIGLNILNLLPGQITHMQCLIEYLAEEN